MPIVGDQREIKATMTTATADTNTKKKNTFHQQIVLKFKEEATEVLHLERISFGPGTWTRRKVY
jgi:hypothetical protein